MCCATKLVVSDETRGAAELGLGRVDWLQLAATVLKMDRIRNEIIMPLLPKKKIQFLYSIIAKYK